MLREDTVEQGTLVLIKRFMGDEKLKHFNLVGGTALALTIGHRTSEDIDLFTSTKHDLPALGDHLSSVYKAEDVRVRSFGIFSFVNDVKVDVIVEEFPTLQKPQIVDGIRMVTPLEIAAMKLNAIVRSGKRHRDFVDMHVLLERFSLEQMVKACQQKYKLDPGTIIKSLLYHNDVELRPIKFLSESIEWTTIAERLREAQKNPKVIFSSNQGTSIQKDDHKHQHTKRRNRRPKL